MKKLTLLLIVAFFGGGCSPLKGDGKPDASDGRKHFEHLYKQSIDDGTIKVVDFQKVNAVDHKNQYDLMWKAKIEYLKDADKGCCPLFPGLPSGGPFKAGETQSMEGTYLYFPTENGYKIRTMTGKYEEPY